MDQQLTHAGGVVFRREGDESLYLVVSASDGQNWVLPKGHIDPGESADVAALREIAEEAGVVGELVQQLSVQPLNKNGVSSLLQYFLIRAVDSIGTTEHRTICWKDEQAALELLSFADAKAALQEGAAALRQLEPVDATRPAVRDT